MFQCCHFSLGPLVNKVKEFQVETIVDTLCSNMLSDKEQLRDISSIGNCGINRTLYVFGGFKFKSYSMSFVRKFDDVR